MLDELLSIKQAVAFIRDQGYDPNMTRYKIYDYFHQGWFDVVEIPGGTGRPRIRKASIVDAYENPRVSRRFPYRGSASGAVPARVVGKVVEVKLNEALQAVEAALEAATESAQEESAAGG